MPRWLLRSFFAWPLAALALTQSGRSQCLTWDAPFLPDLDVRALVVFDDGSGPALFAGGYFTTIGGIPANHIAKWNGHSWAALGVGVNAPVLALATFDDGSGPALYVGGSFTTAGGISANRIAKWQASGWSPLGVGLDDTVHVMEVFNASGTPELYVGGDFFHAGGSTALGIARWSGSGWSAVGSQDLAPLYALAVFQSGGQRFLYAGGGFHNGSPGGNIAKWDGSNWLPVGGGVAGPDQERFVNSMTVFDDGTGSALYAGGNFTTAGGTPANGMARWNGTSWSAVGLGVRGMWSAVTALCAFDDGAGSALYAGGYFVRAGTTPANNIARWDGHTWSPLRHGVNATVWTLAAFDGNARGAPDLYVGGAFYETDEQYEGRLAIWKGCQGPGTLMCFGDGSAASCPCANSGLPDHGCENSIASGGGLLWSTGSTSPDTVLLHGSGELTSAFTIFLQGDAALSVPHVFGDGLLCAGGQLLRLYNGHANGGEVTAPGPGDPPITTRSASLGDPLGSGSVRYYQAYYRDPSPTFCPAPAGASFNASNALRIVW